MTTPAVHVPATPLGDRIRTPLLVSLVVGTLIAAALAFGLATDDTAPSTSTDTTSVTSEEGLLDQVARANVAGATSGTAAAGPAVTAESTRQQVLEELYRINGVYPPEPVVPSTAR